MPRNREQLSSRLQQAVGDSERDADDRADGFDAPRNARDRVRAAEHETLARPQIALQNAGGAHIDVEMEVEGGHAAEAEGEVAIGSAIPPRNVPQIAPTPKPKPKPKPKPHSSKQVRAGDGATGPVAAADKERELVEGEQQGERTHHVTQELHANLFGLGPLGADANAANDTESFGYRPRVLTWDGTLPRTRERDEDSVNAHAPELSAAASHSGDETTSTSTYNRKKREGSNALEGAEVEQVRAHCAPDTDGTKARGGRVRSSGASERSSGHREVASPSDRQQGMKPVGHSMGGAAPRTTTARDRNPHPVTSPLLIITTDDSHNRAGGEPFDTLSQHNEKDQVPEPASSGLLRPSPETAGKAFRNTSDADPQRLRSDRDREGLVPSGHVRARVHEHEHQVPRATGAVGDRAEGGGAVDSDRPETFEKVDLNARRAAFEPQQKSRSRERQRAPEELRTATQSPEGAAPKASSTQRADKRPRAEGDRSDLARGLLDSVIGAPAPDEDEDELSDREAPHKPRRAAANVREADAEELEFEQMANTNLALSADYEHSTGDTIGAEPAAGGAARKSSESGRRPRKKVSRGSFRTSPARDALEHSADRTTHEEQLIRSMLPTADPIVEPERSQLRSSEQDDNSGTLSTPQLLDSVDKENSSTQKVHIC